MGYKDLVVHVPHAEQNPRYVAKAKVVMLKTELVALAQALFLVRQNLAKLRGGKYCNFKT
jgi:hypothetical protein